jgi:hypothetical protein
VRDYRPRVSWVLLCMGIAAAHAETGRPCVALSAVVANVSWMLCIPDITHGISDDPMRRILADSGLEMSPRPLKQDGGKPTA